MRKIDGYFRAPNRARLREIERIFREIDYCELEFSVVRADFGDISEVRKGSVSRRDRRKNRTNAIESAIRQLGGIFFMISHEISRHVSHGGERE